MKTEKITLTRGNGHMLEVGDRVKISGLTTGQNGYFTVIEVLDLTTIILGDWYYFLKLFFSRIARWTDWIDV